MGPYLLGEWRYRQIGRLFLSEARLPVFASKGAVVSKRALVRARRAPLMAGGRLICFEGHRHGREERFSYQKGAFADGRGAVSAWNGAAMCEKGTLS